MKWNVYHFDCLESTNDTARSYPPNSVIVAAEQTAGRGRLGRVWQSKRGNLFLSAVVPDYGLQTPLLAFVAGLAVGDALADFGVRLKWPNDVLLNGGKVCGILLERTEENHIIVGIGVNVAVAPQAGMMYRTACLNGAITVQEAEERVLKALERNLNDWEKNGFEPIRNRWLAKAAGLNENVKVNLPDIQITGIFKDLSPQGELVLETPDKTVQKIVAGDVFLTGNEK